MKFINFFLIFIAIQCNECSYTKGPIDLHFGSKTPYQAVANEDVTQIKFPGCQIKKILMVIRHGIRNPNIPFIQNMNGRLNEIRKLILQNNSNSTLKFRNRFEGHFGEMNLDELKGWTHELKEEDNKVLSKEGGREMFELARRMQLRFPTLFPILYDNTTYVFKTTEYQRTEASVVQFAAGLFGRESITDLWYQTSIDIDLDRTFYRDCPLWLELVDENFAAYRELRLFKQSPPILELVRVINHILNLDNALSIDDVYLMYDVCSLEVTWNKTANPVWCSIFTLKMLKTLEFGKDIEYYIKHGYANNINYKLACPLFQHIINYFELDEYFPTTALYFSHSGSVLKMLVLLGLYKDKEPITHANVYNLDRQWSLNKVNPYGSNLAFILLRCGARKKLALYHLERLIRLPGCEENICDLSTVKEQYADRLLNCDFDDTCKL